MEGVAELIVKGLGAGLKGTIVGYISRYLPAGVPAELVGLLLGGVMYYYGDRIHGYVKVFGEGVLIAAVGQIVASLVAKMTAPPAVTAPAVAVATPESVALAYAMR